MDGNDLLMGGGIKSAAFPDQQFGTTVGGPVVRDPQSRQQTDFDTGKPKFYEDGKPAMQVVVHVQTNDRDPADPTDDGVRAFYIKGQMTEAVRSAVRAARAPGIKTGGQLYVTYVRDEPNSRGRGKPKKIYEARYVAPIGAGNEALMGSQPTPAQQPAVQPAAVGSDGIEMPPGFDAGTWAVLDTTARAKVRAAMGLQ